MKIEIHIEKVLVEGADIAPDDLMVLEGSTKAGIEQLWSNHEICPEMHFSREIQTIQRHYPSQSNAAGPKLLGWQIADAILGGIGGGTGK